MSDYFTGLGNTGFRRFDTNWKNGVDYSFENSLRVIDFDGPVEIVELSDKKPHKFEFSGWLRTKQEEYEFIEWFKSVRGRWGKFWFASPSSFFSVKADIGASDTAIEIERVDFEFTGEERIYLELVNGDILTFKMAGFEHVNLETSRLLISSAVGRVITKKEINRFGLCILGRLENDAIILKSLSKEGSEVTIAVIELVNEYGDA